MNKTHYLLAASMLLASCAGTETKQRDIEVVVHRGANALAPENTNYRKLNANYHKLFYHVHEYTIFDIGHECNSNCYARIVYK